MCYIDSVHMHICVTNIMNANETNHQIIQVITSASSILEDANDQQDINHQIVQAITSASSSLENVNDQQDINHQIVQAITSASSSLENVNDQQDIDHQIVQSNVLVSSSLESTNDEQYVSQIIRSFLSDNIHTRSDNISIKQLDTWEGLDDINLLKDTDAKWICTCCNEKFARTTLGSTQDIPTRLFNVPKLKVFKMIDLCSSCTQEAHQYFIISHVWGNTVPYDGKSFGVEWPLLLKDPNKLIKCLRLAKTCEATWIWIDVLCIDQSDIYDQEKEVPKMKDYYKNGQKVLVILDDLAEPALLALNNFVSNHKSIVTDEVAIRVLLQTCSKIKNDPWVKRIWTLQELILANRIVFCSGNSLVDCGELRLKPKDIDQFEIELSNHGVMYGEDFESVTLSDGLLDRTKYQERALGILSELISMQKQRKSKREHDKIYGLLGLLYYGDQIRVDYSLPFSQLQRNVVEIALKNGDTSALSFTGMCMFKSIHGPPDIFHPTSFFPFNITNTSSVLNANVLPIGMRATWTVLGKVGKVKTLQNFSQPGAGMYIGDICKSSTVESVIKNASSIGLSQAMSRIRNTEFIINFWKEMTKPHCQIEKVIHFSNMSREQIDKLGINRQMFMFILRSELFIGSIVNTCQCCIAEIEDPQEEASPYEMSTSCLVIGHPSPGDLILDIGCAAFRWGKVVMIVSKNEENNIWRKVGISVLWDVMPRNIYRNDITVEL